MSRIAILLGLLLSGPAWAQGLDVPSILDTASPNAAEAARLFWWVAGFSILVLVVVVAFLGAGIVRGWRHRHMTEEPPQTHGNLALEITWTTVPLVILGVLLVLTIGSIYRLSGFAAPEDALEVEVVGRQFWWEMTYTDAGVVSANELVVPLGRPVKLDLASTDVMHSFWVPQLAGKTDLIPGNERVLWFTPEREGIFYGQCAELCGDSHANMRLRVRVVSPQAFDAWLEAAAQPAEPPSGQLAQAGHQLFLRKGCIGCHAVQGLSTANRVGPDLSHVGSRSSIAAGVLANTPENMTRWLLDPGEVKPGVLMPDLGLSPEEAEALTAYLATLRLPGLDEREIFRAEYDRAPDTSADDEAQGPLAGEQFATQERDQ